jgi:hypothetical protein
MTIRMHKKISLRAAALALLLVGVRFEAARAQIQWITDGKLAASSNASQVHLSAVPDGFGGVFIAYENSPAGDPDIIANRIDASGTRRWNTGGAGVVVSSGTGNQRYPAVAPDGSGGAFVAWQDEVTGDIMAQHYNSAGVTLWASSGIAVCSAAGEQTMVKAETDGAGGVILVWQDKRDYGTTGIDLYAQRLNGAGAAQWTANGASVCTATGNQTSQVIVSDKAGGVIVAWQDTRNGTGNYDIYAQRLNASGVPQYISNGVSVCAAPNSQMNPCISASGAKWIVSWDDGRGASTDIYAQALDVSGNMLWTADGVPVCAAANAQTMSRVVDDGQNGAIVVWGDNRTGYDIYAQRLNPAGSVQWTADGIAVNQSALYQYNPEAVSDGSGGAIVVWNDNRSGSDINLYGQRVDGSGALMWPSAGQPIAVQTGTQQNHVLVSDESGGAIALWQDGRSGTSDVYAQLMNDALNITSPAAGALWAGTQAKTLQWTGRVSANKFHHFNISASAAPGDGFPVSIATNVAASAVSQSWTASTVNSATVQVRIQAFNSQGVQTDEYLSPVFTVDSNPPAAFDLTSPAGGSTTDLKPAFAWQATTDALSGLDHYELWIDNALVQDNLAVTTYQLTDAQKLSSASHTWTVKAVDRAGQIRTATSTWNLTASDDTTPPNPFHLLSPANNAWTAQATPALSWEQAVDAGRGIGKYQLYVDGTLVRDNIAAGVTSSNAPTLTAGPHTWFIKAVDLANNVTQSVETWTLRVDNVQPAAFDLASPANNVWTSNNAPSFSWSASSDAGSGLSVYQLVVDGQVKVDNIPAGTTGAPFPAGQTLAEGTHAWSVTAKDVLGNSRNSTSTFTVGIDVTAPPAAALSAPANGAWVTQSSPVFTWQASTDARSGIKEYQLYVDDAVNRSGLTATTATAASPLSEGAHNWSVKAIDNAGNSTLSTPFGFNGDFTPPAPFSLISPANGGTLHTNRPQYRWRSTSDARSGFQKFEFYVDGVLKNGYLGATDTSITLTETLGNGQHKWKAVAWDRAGNIRDSGEAVFTVQLTPPVITSPSTAAATEHSIFTYTATATDAEGDPLAYSFENYPAWLTPSGSAISGTPPENSPTSGSFKVNVSDGTYTSSLIVQMAIQMINDPPVFSSSPTATATEHQSFTYTAAAADPEGTPVTFTFSNFPAWMTPSGSAISGTPGEGDKNSSFKITASDGVLSTVLNVNLAVVAVNDPPVITSPASATAKEDVPFSYTAAASDPEGGSVRLTYKNLPRWLAVSGNSVRGSVPETCADTSFAVIADDGVRYDTLIVAVKVELVNDPPVLTSAGSATATEHQPFTYTAAAADPENNPITFTFSNYPAWATPAGNRLTGTPREGDKNTVFTVTASDGQLTTPPMTVNLTLISVNDPPVITSPDSVIAREDVPFSYPAAATDPEGDPVRFSFKKLPRWLTASGNTVRGTLPETGRDTTFAVIAGDGILSDTLMVFIKAETINDAPTITSPAQAAATEKQPFSYTATASDPDGPRLSILYLDFPSWLTQAGPVLSGTPDDVPENLSFKVVATDGSLSDTLLVALHVTQVNDPPRFKYAFPDPTVDASRSFQWQLNLDDYAFDPDDPDSVLTWTYKLLDSVRVGVTIHPKTHLATFFGLKVDSDFHVAFTVTDPHGGGASDTIHVNVNTTGIEVRRIAEAPKIFTLYDNYPNPFNPATVIRYGLPRSCHVSLKVFNVRGREVAVLVDGRQNSGVFEARWDASASASGIYFCVIQTDSWKQVKRMTLMK